MNKVTRSLPGQAEPRADHLRLGPDFYDPVTPVVFPKHIVRYRNQVWAERVGLGDLDEAAWVDHCGRFEPIPGSLEQPLALRYHGHQFRTYNPDLGDGRGFLYAQLTDPVSGRLLDLGTKGSGQTPWSRDGDGRLTLKGGVREVLATTLLEARGVDTSKTFSVIETGERLYRNDEPSPTRSCVLVRLSHGHIRIGSFQRLAALNQGDNLRKLLAYAVETYWPAVRSGPEETLGVRFLTAVRDACARTCAQWTVAGFVHGVLNTDNINITGESFDYGPYRFLPTYDPAFTAAYFDHTGLYAFGRQPATMAWNLARLAECLMIAGAPRADLVAVLQGFEAVFEQALGAATCARLGVRPADAEAAVNLAATLFAFLQDTQAPFDQVWHDWFQGEARENQAKQSPCAHLYKMESFKPVRHALASVTPMAPDCLEHPALHTHTPVGLLIEEIETLWDAIADHDDWRPLAAKLVSIAAWADAVGRPLGGQEIHG